MNIKLSIVIPVFNEKKRLTDGLSHYYSYLSSQKYPWEIIVVNDGSTDKTLNLINEFKKGKKGIEVISYEKNRGKGFAICEGVNLASGDYILFTDIDHSVPIETVEGFFEYFKNGIQVVIGSRRVEGAVIAKHQSVIRESLGRGFTAIVNMFIYPQIADATCGFKAFERKTAQKIFRKITVYNWAFDAEILYICKKQKIKIAQAPVVWSDVRGTKVLLFKDIASSLKGIFKIRINGLSGKY